MAQDMLNAIFEAEEECKQREIQAKENAVKSREQAQKDASALVKQAVSDAENKAQQLFDSIKTDSNKELENARLAAKNDCERISKTAEKNRSKVINDVVDLLTS